MMVGAQYVQHHISIIIWQHQNNDFILHCKHSSILYSIEIEEITDINLKVQTQPNYWQNKQSTVIYIMLYKYNIA